MDKGDRKILKEHVMRAYAASNLGDRAFARRIGVSHVELYKILNCEANLKLSTLERIANGLGVEVWELFEPE